MTSPSTLDNPLRESEFVAHLRAEIRAGFSLIPFVGSGLSAPSGIMMGQEFTNYLTWAVFCSVAGPKGDSTHRHDIHRQGWPETPDDKQVECARMWVADHFKVLCEEDYDIGVILVGERGRESVRSLDLSPKASEKLRNKSKSEFKHTRDQLVSAIQRPMVPQILRNADTNVDDERLQSFWQLVGGSHNSHGWCLPREVSTTSEKHVEEDALRSLHDWRAALNFLSRLRQIPLAAAGQPRLVLGECDQSIIDKFNLHITRGRRPNFAHSMLCHLAGPARIRTLLTTNFDTLIEDAFTDLHQHYEVIPVSITGALPHPDTVHSLNCVIKLHGSLTETRADYSLNNAPCEEDKNRFFNYVRGGHPYIREIPYRAGHLLVLGYSGSDVRCVQMIKSVLDLDSSAKVFWVCHSDTGHDSLSRLVFPESEYRGRVVSVITHCPDLLLYELYQQLTLCLPGGGFTYQLSPNMPPGRDYREKTLPLMGSGLESDSANICDAIRTLEKAIPSGKFITVDSASGTTAPLRRAFFDATRNGIVRTGLWLELEDYINLPHLAHEILQIISVRIGRFQLDHANLIPRAKNVSENWPGPFKDWSDSWRNHCTLLFATWGFRPDSWLIIFYSRNGPGGCSGWSDTYWDEKQGAPELLEFLRILSELGFKIVYAPYSKERYKRDLRKEEATFDRSAELLKKPERLFFGEEDNTTGIEPDYRVSKGNLEKQFREMDREALLYVEKEDLDVALPVRCAYDQGRRFEEILDDVINKWIEVNPANMESASSGTRSRYFRRAFLYGCTLFRQSRHYAAFFTDAILACPSRFNANGIDNDWQRLFQLTSCLRELDNIRIFHRKPGGFAWMHRDLRLGIRNLLESADATALDNIDVSRIDSDREKEKIIGRMRQLRSSNHLWIADWYTKAFQTTGHALPLIEALYHFVQCAKFAAEAARFAPRSSYKALNPHKPDISQLIRRCQYRRGLWKIAILRLIKCLRIGSPVLKLWLQEPVSSALFERESTGFGGAEVLKILGEARNAITAVTKRAQSLCSGVNTDVSILVNERKEVLKCWKSLRPLVKHELDSIVRNSRDLPTYTASEGFSETDISQAFIPKRDFGTALDEAFYLSLDCRWHEVICSELSNMEKIANKNAQPILEELQKFIKALIIKKTYVCGMDLHDLARRFQFNTSIEVSDLPLSFVELIGELGYIWIRRAKLREHGIKFVKEPIPCLLLSEPDVRRLWTQACVLCRLVLDLAAHLHPRHLQAEVRLRVKFSALYGLAMGRLNRFFEAHRRLNEATALLSKVDAFRDNPPLPILELRRAEVQLLEAHLLGQITAYFDEWQHQWDKRKEKDKNPNEQPLSKDLCWELCCRAFVRGRNPNILKDSENIRVLERSQNIMLSTSEKENPEEKAKELWLNLYLERRFERDIIEQGKRAQDVNLIDPVQRLLRLHVAKLDEAWVTLENAERLLSGRSQSSLWWSRLHSLQLKVIAECKFIEQPLLTNACNRMLAFRMQHSHQQYVQELFLRGLCAAPADLFRFVRLLDYFIPAHKHAVIMDQLQREPSIIGASSHDKAQQTHNQKIKRIISDIKKWCPDNFGIFKRRINKNSNLLDKYCTYVYKKNREIFEECFDYKHTYQE